MNNIDQLLAKERLPPAYRDFVDGHIAPMARWIRRACDEQTRNQPLLVGINGAQGTGKTTLCRFLETFLAPQLPCLTLSLDDFYLGADARQRLAHEVHPLLATRGVPGTHDIELLGGVLAQLSAGDLPRLPRFDKATDDCIGSDEWRRPAESPVIILLEGWCIGASAQPDADLAEPINALERAEDSDGRWRHYVNDQLRERYMPVFAKLQRLVMLRAPSMQAILRWRELQESKLRDTGGSAVMSPADVVRFVAHYERITRQCLQRMPDYADYVLQFDESHAVTEVKQR